MFDYISTLLITENFNVICTFSLLLHRECCTFSNGEFVKAGLDELELWCGQATEEVLFSFVSVEMMFLSILCLYTIIQVTY